MKAFGMTDMAIEIADKQGIFSRRQQGRTDVTGKEDFCGFVVQMEIA